MLSTANRSRLAAIADGLGMNADELRALLLDTEPEADRLARDIAELRSRASALGVPLN